VRPRYSKLELEVREEGDCLQRLAKAHLISKNRVHSIGMHHREPAQTMELIVAHLYRAGDLLGLLQILVKGCDDLSAAMTRRQLTGMLYSLF